MKKITQIFCVLAIASLLFMPSFSIAQEREEGQGLVPCATDRNSKMCDFQDLMRLINNVVNFIFTFLALPIVALMAAYAGVTMVVSAGSPESRTKAKNILWDAIIGFLLVACSWVIIKTLLTVMGYKDTGLFF